MSKQNQPFSEIYKKNQPFCEFSLNKIKANSLKKKAYRLKKGTVL